MPGFFELVHITNTERLRLFQNNNAFVIAISCIALIIVVMLCFCGGVYRMFGAISRLRYCSRNPGKSYRSSASWIRDRFSAFRSAFLTLIPRPAFNIADSCITIAVVCFIVHSYFGKISQARSSLRPPRQSVRINRASRS